MSPRSTFLALAAVAAATLSFAAASPAIARTGSVAIGYGDLNLASQAGRAVLDRRIAGAAGQVCDGFASRELKMIMLGRACRAEVIAAAHEQVSGLLAAAGASGQYASITVSRAAF